MKLIFLQLFPGCNGPAEVQQWFVVVSPCELLIFQPLSANLSHEL